MEEEAEKSKIATLYKDELRSEEITEVVSAVPSWIVRWGITLILVIIGGILLLSSFINYPDVVKTGLKINSSNAPKSLLAQKNGKITDLIVADGAQVQKGAVIAFTETTALPTDVIKLSEFLEKLSSLTEKETSIASIQIPTGLRLGDLQSSFQRFHQEYLQFIATQDNGYHANRRRYLKQELSDVEKSKAQILAQQNIQRLEYKNAEEEYEKYKSLYNKNVISRAEFMAQENKFLSSKYPLQQTETSLLTNTSSNNSKQKELMELEFAVTEQRAKFFQALSQMAMETDAWLLQNVFRAPVSGKLTYAGILQEGQNLTAGKEVFIINPGNEDFFGEINIPQYNMGKVVVGQEVLVKMKSFPFEQYGMIRGKLKYISETAFNDSVFVAKVSLDKFENKDTERKIILKNGMNAEAEIITEKSSLLQRFFRNITKTLNSGG